MLSAAVVISALKDKIGSAQFIFFSEKKVLIFDVDPLADNSHGMLSLIFSEQ